MILFFILLWILQLLVLFIDDNYISRKHNKIEFLIHTIYTAWFYLIEILIGNFSHLNILFFKTNLILFLPVLLSLISLIIIDYIDTKYFSNILIKRYKLFYVISLIIMLLLMFVIPLCSSLKLNDLDLYIIDTIIFIFFILFVIFPKYFIKRIITKDKHVLNDLDLPNREPFNKLHLKYVTNEKYLEILNLLNNKLIPDYKAAYKYNNFQLVYQCLNVIENNLNKIDINRINKNDVKIEKKIKRDLEIINKIEDK